MNICIDTVTEVYFSTFWHLVQRFTFQLEKLWHRKRIVEYFVYNKVPY